MLLLLCFYKENICIPQLSRFLDNKNNVYYNLVMYITIAVLLNRVG